MKTCERSRAPTWFEHWSPGRTGSDWFWVILGMSCVTVSLSLYVATGAKPLLVRVAPVSAGAALIPLGMKVIYGLLSGWESSLTTFVVRPKSEPQSWYRDQFEAFLRTPVPICVGFLWMALSIGAFSLAGTFGELGLQIKAAAIVTLGFAAFVCGVGLTSIFYLGRVIWQLGSSPVTVAAHRFGVLSTGDILLKCYVVIAAIWCVYTSSAVWNVATGWITMVLLAVPAVFFIVGSFVVCQLPLHWRMVDFKHTLVRDLEQQIAALQAKNLDTLSDRERQLLVLLRSLSKEALPLPEWPFRWKALAGVFVFSIGAIAPAIVSTLIRSQSGN